MELSAGPARTKLRLLGACGVFFAVVGVWMASDAPIYSMDWWLGCAVALFFFFCGVILLRRSRVSGPVLIINSNGIFDSRMMDEVIPWSAIETIADRRFPGHLFALYLSRRRRDFVRSPGKLLNCLMNQLFGAGHVYVLLNGLDTSAEAVRAAIMHYKSLSD